MAVRVTELPSVEVLPLHSGVPGPCACAKPEGPYSAGDFFEVRCRACWLAFTSIAIQTPEARIEDWIVGDRPTMAEVFDRYQGVQP